MSSGFGDRNAAVQLVNQNAVSNVSENLISFTSNASQMDDVKHLGENEPRSASGERDAAVQSVNGHAEPNVLDTVTLLSFDGSDASEMGDVEYLGDNEPSSASGELDAAVQLVNRHVSDSLNLVRYYEKYASEMGAAEYLDGNELSSASGEREAAMQLVNAVNVIESSASGAPNEIDPTVDNRNAGLASNIECSDAPRTSFKMEEMAASLGAAPEYSSDDSDVVETAAYYVSAVNYDQSA